MVGDNSSGSEGDGEQYDGNRVRFSGDIGVGKPLEGDDRRDFTVKASRRPAPPPPSAEEANSSLSETSLVRSNSTPSSTPPRPRPTHKYSSSSSSTPSRPTRSHHKHSSSTSSIHEIIPDPQYVRSQPIGLQRSSSFADVPLAPTLSGGLARKLSVSTLDGEDEDEEKVPSERPLKHRSESLPSFPPKEVLEQRKIEQDLSELPLDPKQWRPSQLATYIAARFPEGLPSRVEADVITFVRTSGLNGRSFIRLRDTEMEEMGINVRWRSLLSEIREKLRREALSGRIWGFEGVRIGDDREEEEEVAPLRRFDYPSEGEEEKEDWKNSWRRTEGNRSAGRVKGMAQAFETPEPTPEPKPRRPKSYASNSCNSIRIPFPASHSRSDSMESTTSTASIDSGSEDSAPPLSPFDFGETATSPDESAVLAGGSTFTAAPTTYQSNISSHIEGEARPYGLVRRPSQRGRSSVGTTRRAGEAYAEIDELPDHSRSASSVNRDMGDESNEEEGDRTVKTSIGGHGASKGSSALADLFGIDISPERGGARTSKEMDREIEDTASIRTGKSSDLMVMQVGGRGGSMVMVKKSQLAELQRRMDEVELQLADALSASRPISPTSDPEPSAASLSGWVRQSFNAVTDTPPSPTENKERHEGPLSWTALGGYMIAASLGIGLVAGEVVVSRLFGVRRR